MSTCGNHPSHTCAVETTPYKLQTGYCIGYCYATQSLDIKNHVFVVLLWLCLLLQEHMSLTSVLRDRHICRRFFILAYVWCILCMTYYGESLQRACARDAPCLVAMQLFPCGCACAVVFYAPRDCKILGKFLLCCTACVVGGGTWYDGYQAYGCFVQLCEL